MFEFGPGIYFIQEYLSKDESKSKSFHPAVKQLSGGTLNWMAPEYFAMEKFKMTAPGNVWAFGMTALVNHLTALSKLAVLNSFLQELFTRKHPLNHLKNDGVIIMHHKSGKELECPKDDASCSRLMQGWWNILYLSCWKCEPSDCAEMSSIVEDIKVCNCQVSNPG